MNRARLVTLIRDRFVLVKAAGIILWLAWFVSIALNGFTRDIEGKPIGADHLAFYSAARLIDAGRGQLIYDNDFQSTFQPTLVNHPGPFLDAYRNPPFYALLYVPTSRLPYLASFWIWTAVSAACLWLGLGWLGAKNRVGAFALAFSFYPVFAVFSFGQNSLLSFAIFCLVFRLLERSRPLTAGLAAGLLLFKPQLLLGLGLWWLLSVRQHWKCFAGLAMAGLFWLAVSVLFVPAESRLFVERLREIAAYDAFEFWNMHNPRGFGTLIACDNKPFGQLFGLACSVAAIAYFLYFWRQHRENRALMFAAVLFLTLWASPHTMIYEWTLALIPAVLLWDRVPEKCDDWVLLFALAWVALFISTPLTRAELEQTRQILNCPGWAIQVSVPIMAVAGIWAERVLRRSV